MIEVLNLSQKEVDTQGLKRITERILKGQGVKEEVELSIALLDESAMAEINMKHRGKKEPTDVLSFDFKSGVSKQTREKLPILNLGQIFICPSVVKERLIKGEEFETGLARALAHGLLHIFGYNHKGKEEEEAMMKKQDFYINKANFDL